MKFLHHMAIFLSRPAIVFYSLPALMILLVAGTLAQAELGLYAAQQTYFSSFLVWVGPSSILQLPLPGAYLLIGLLTLNLLIKFLFFSEWSFRKSGIILSHLGVLVLLLGGLLTALFAQEGYMAIPEGERSAYLYDYHKRNMVVFKDETPVARFSFDRLVPGQILKSPDLPFNITILNSCKNCDILKRDETPQAFINGDLRDLAEFMALSRTTTEKEDEANLSGLTLNISGADRDHNGVYIAFEAMPRAAEIQAKGETYALIFGKEQRRLPFSIELHDFQKDDYPGSLMARAFRSSVTVHDHGTSWDAVISMNKPLRYKGYTFYQASFEQSPEADTTVLSVVDNDGRIFPYVGTLITALGLILHLILALRGRGRSS